MPKPRCCWRSLGVPLRRGDRWQAHADSPGGDADASISAYGGVGIAFRSKRATRTSPGSCPHQDRLGDSRAQHVKVWRQTNETIEGKLACQTKVAVTGLGPRSPLHGFGGQPPHGHGRAEVPARRRPALRGYGVVRVLATTSASVRCVAALSCSSR
jgi:hypothetical protein